MGVTGLDVLLKPVVAEELRLTVGTVARFGNSVTEGSQTPREKAPREGAPEDRPSSG
jgi:hypothetical protein